LAVLGNADSPGISGVGLSCSHTVSAGDGALKKRILAIRVGVGSHLILCSVWYVDDDIVKLAGHFDRLAISQRAVAPSGGARGAR